MLPASEKRKRGEPLLSDLIQEPSTGDSCCAKAAGATVVATGHFEGFVTTLGE